MPGSRQPGDPNAPTAEFDLETLFHWRGVHLILFPLSVLTPASENHSTSLPPTVLSESIKYLQLIRFIILRQREDKQRLDWICRNVYSSQYFLRCQDQSLISRSPRKVIRYEVWSLGEFQLYFQALALFSPSPLTIFNYYLSGGFNERIDAVWESRHHQTLSPTSFSTSVITHNNNLNSHNC